MKKNLNQKLINLIEYYNLINANFLLSDNPIVRSIDNSSHVYTGNRSEQLSKLKTKISILLEKQNQKN